VSLSLFTDFTNFIDFTPAQHQVAALTALFDQVISRSNALAAVRLVTHPHAARALDDQQADRADRLS